MSYNSITINPHNAQKIYNSGYTRNTPNPRNIHNNPNSRNTDNAGITNSSQTA